MIPSGTIPGVGIILLLVRAGVFLCPCRAGECLKVGKGSSQFRKSQGPVFRKGGSQVQGPIRPLSRESGKEEIPTFRLTSNYLNVQY